MSEERIEHVVLIGAGNLGSHLGSALVSHGIRVTCVYNRTPGPGRKLADRLGADFVTDIDALERNADLYILALADSALPVIAGSLRLNDRFVVHTSGTTDLEVLSEISGNTGVFYPLQTFPAGREISFEGIPVCIESNTVHGQQLLGGLAQELTGNVHCVNSNDRRMIHLSAVYACNFTNFMLAIAEDLLQTQGLPPLLLQPLVKQTCGNFEKGDVFRFQTGPAVRGDFRILENHLELLKNNPDYAGVYNEISNAIIKYKRVHGKL